MPRSRGSTGFGVLGRSFPNLLVNRVLCRQGAVKGWILSPTPRNVIEIALAQSELTQARAASKGFNCYLVQAFSLLASSAAKGGIQILRNIADGVLHANSIGTAGTCCKRACQRLQFGGRGRRILRPICCYFFSSAGQFTRNVIGSGLFSLAGVSIRNRCPSGEGR